MKARNLIPLGIFLGLVVLLGVGLTLDPREVPSPLIDKPAPAFELPRLQAPDQTIGTADMKGKVWILNVFASWCVSCRAEHKVVNRFARMGLAPVIGLNYKDEPEDARRWLAALGNPYTASAMDRKGQVGIDWGVYGVPESFIIDKRGIIRYKQIGPITDQVLDEKIVPLIRKLKEES